jgi:hypothetical protein
VHGARPRRAAVVGADLDRAVTLASGSNPRAAVNPAGDAVVGFDVVSLAKTISRTHGTAHWTEPATLAEGASAPDVAFDDAGDAFAAFTKGRWPNIHTQAAFRGGVEGRWQEAVTSSPGSETGVLAQENVAVDPAGDAVVVFDRWSGNGYVIQSAPGGYTVMVTESRRDRR